MVFDTTAAIYDSEYLTENQINGFLDKYKIDDKTEGDPFQDCVADYYDLKYFTRISSCIE